jgi:signal transduction histidine kinase
MITSMAEPRHKPLWPPELSFSAQFLVLALVVLAAGMTALGAWAHVAIEEAVVSNTSAVTALYVDSFIGPLVDDYAADGEVSASGIVDLDSLLTDTPLGDEIVSFKIWDRNGTILYSPNPDLIGQVFPMETDLEEAFTGDVVTAISDLGEPENVYERTQWETLIETYAPVRAQGSNLIVAVAEFYQLPDALNEEIRSAQITGWAIVGVATVIMYLALVGMVRRATRTIRTQHSELSRYVADLEETLEENRSLQRRIRGAASRTTTLNERYLTRVSADIHDGPAQGVALALLRIDDVAESVGQGGNGMKEEILSLRNTLDSALGDLRSIAQGLRSPVVDATGPCKAARRAVADFERNYDRTVIVRCDGEDVIAPVATSITVYRVVQESLVNSFRHARADRVELRLERTPDQLTVTIEDDGVGFDLERPRSESRLGIAGMRERVEMIGGSFRIASVPGGGTTVSATIPLTSEKGDV